MMLIGRALRGRQRGDDDGGERRRRRWRPIRDGLIGGQGRTAFYEKQQGGQSQPYQSQPYHQPRQQQQQQQQRPPPPPQQPQYQEPRHNAAVPVAVPVAYYADAPPPAIGTTPKAHDSAGMAKKGLSLYHSATASDAYAPPASMGGSAYWSGPEIPAIGMPVEVLYPRPTPVEGADGKAVLQLVMDPTHTLSPESADITATLGQLTEKTNILHKVLYGHITIEKGVKAADKAVQIALCAAPGGMAIGMGVGVAAGTAKGVGTAHLNKTLANKIVEHSRELAGVVTKGNARARATAMAAGATTYLRMAVCEQAVSLNQAQAIAVEVRLNPSGNRKERLLTTLTGGQTSAKDMATNRFPVLELCPSKEAENVETLVSEPLVYDIHETHFAELKIKKNRGRVRLLGTVVQTAAHAAMYPVNKYKDSAHRKQAEIKEVAALPAYGDFIIRRFVCLIPTPVTETGLKPMLRFPPVYSHTNPNEKLSLDGLLFPDAVHFHPGPVPPPMEYTPPKGFILGRNASYEVYNPTTGERRQAEAAFVNHQRGARD